MIEESKTGNGWPFLKYTIDEVYPFFKNHLRPADDILKNEPYAYFVFIVIDDACLTAETYECIVCTDAPDYNDPDGFPTLKTLRVPIETAADLLTPLDQLTMTPSEAFDPSSGALGTVPPFTAKQVPGTTRVGEDDLQRVVSPAEARRHKQRAMALKPEKGETSYDEERPVSLFWVGRGEALHIAHTYLEVEYVAKRGEGKLHLFNRPDEEFRERWKGRMTREQRGRVTWGRE